MTCVAHGYLYRNFDWCMRPPMVSILPPLIRLAGDLLDGGDGELNGGSEMVVLRKVVVL